MNRIKDIVVIDLEAVINNLKFKKKYLQEDNLPKSLDKNNIIDEDIDYLEKEILPRIKRL